MFNARKPSPAAGDDYTVRMANVYFELTETFNADQPTVALASGQAVVYYRVAIMSKDGDWVIRETPDACARVLDILEHRGARYRPGAPLDVRWLAGGWSAHFEFADERGRRIRCDFVSRPPRVPQGVVEALFAESIDPARLNVVPLEALVLMKQTHRAKDYAVIGELVRQLPPAREIELTTDPDRIGELATTVGASSARPAVVAARCGLSRREIVTRVAEEVDALQQRDRARVRQYEQAAQPFLAEWRRRALHDLPLREAHGRACALAERWLPRTVGE